MKDQCAQCNSPRPAGRYLCAACEAKLLGTKSERHQSVSEKNIAPASPPPPSQQRATRDASELIVSQWGDGDYTTISAAVNAVRAGGRVLVRPGVYGEEITISKPLEMIGITDAVQVVIQGSLHLHKAKQAHINNVTVRDGGVGIFNSQATFTACRLLTEPSGIREVLNVFGHSEATVRHCLVSGSEYGIYVHAGGRALIEDTEVANCSTDGVVSFDKGEVRLRKCHIHHCGVGVQLDSGSIEDCQLHHCDNGIGISGMGQYQIRNCGIYENSYHGISQNPFVDSGDLEAIIERCTLSGNKESALRLEVGNFVVRHCDMRRNQIGISAQARVVATVEYCDLTQNTLFSYFFSKGADVHLAHNKESRRSFTQRAIVAACDLFNIGGD